MNEKPAEAIARIKSILDSLAQKRDEVEKLTSDMNRVTIMKEKSEKAVDSLRIQLFAELKKFDPDLELAPTEVEARG